MLEKIKKYTKTLPLLWQRIRDVRFLGFMVFVVMVLLATWSGVTVIETNYELQKQIALLDQQNKVQELTNTNLRLKNIYLNSDTYLELTARKQLGKGAPGEKLLLVPKSVALAHAPELPDDTPAAAKEQQSGKKPFYQDNFEAWMDFFFRRNQS